MAHPVHPSIHLPPPPPPRLELEIKPFDSKTLNQLILIDHTQPISAIIIIEPLNTFLTTVREILKRVIFSSKVREKGLVL